MCTFNAVILTDQNWMIFIQFWGVKSTAIGEHIFWMVMEPLNLRQMPKLHIRSDGFGGYCLKLGNNLS